MKKVYSINIIYFDLGKGSDYLYHGKTVFTGVHTGDNLVVNTKEADEIRMTAPENVFPEYYIIRVNEFNKVATTPIEEWLDYLKNNHINDETSTPGLQEAREKQTQILREAAQTRDAIVEQAQEKARQEGSRLLDEAKTAIAQEKNAAIADIRRQVAALSVDIAGKVLRENLKDDKSQMDLIDRMLDEVSAK